MNETEILLESLTNELGIFEMVIKDIGYGGLSAVGHAQNDVRPMLNAGQTQVLQNLIATMKSEGGDNSTGPRAIGGRKKLALA